MMPSSMSEFRTEMMDNDTLEWYRKSGIDDIYDVNVTNWFEVATMAVIFVLGVTSNSLVLLLAMQKKSKKMPKSFTFITNLAIADMIYLGYLPIEMYLEVSVEPINFGKVGCFFFGCVKVS